MEQEQDEFKIRRQRLLEASKTALDKDEIHKVLKEKFKGKNLYTVVDDRTWSISIDFTAFACDPENNKVKRAKDATLTTCGSLYGPITDVLSGANWLLAQAASCRTGDHLQGRRLSNG